jgi:hypothetical protein
MLEQQNGTVRVVAWSDLLPWLILFRCFRLAIRHQMILLSAAAALLTVTGWALVGYIFSGSVPPPGQIQPLGGNPWVALSELVPDRPFGLHPSAPAPTPEPLLVRRPEPMRNLIEPIYGTWEHLSRPWREIFARGLTWTNFAYLLLCGLLATAVWAFFGAAITRMAAVELTTGERIGWGAMLSFARAKWLSFFGAPLASLAFVLVITVPIALVSLVLGWFGVGVFLLGLFWWLFLAGGVVMALLLLGLLFGWPLMWPTIATEGTDGFDACSRSYSYVSEQPLHYLFYSVVAFLFGILGWLLVANFTAAAVQLTYWAAHWGAGSVRIDAIANGSGELGFLGPTGAALIRIWVHALKILAVGFLFSYFWTASTAIYLLMRRKVDAREMDEVALEDEKEAPYGLPPLRTDDSGVPVVSEGDVDEEDDAEKDE